MAEAKITIQTLVDNKELQQLHKDLADGTKKLKEMQKQYRDWAKEGSHTADEMAKLNTAITAQKALNAQNSKGIRNLANELAGAGKQAGTTKEALSNMISDKLGVNLGDLMGKFSSTTALMTGMAAAAATIGAGLINASREVSAFSNQFIAYGKNVKTATEMYNIFNNVYRNTNYDEQKVYDMAKGFMNVGIGAKEAADLIAKCADASASMGQGVEMAEMLGDAFKRLATGGQLTEKQYKAMAEAGIDLSAVQEDIRKGGVDGYNALKKALEQYEGGMQASKQSAAEMEGDIKGNLVEIGRQTALLIDEVFGFSDALKSFYQWLIDVTQSAIDSIRNCMAAFREANASAKAYSSTIESFGEEYDEAMEAARQGDKDAIARLNNMQQQAQLASQTAKEEERIAIAKEKQAAADAKRPQVPSIAGLGGSSGGGSSSGSSKTVDPMKEYQDRAKAVTDAYRSQEQAVKSTNAALETYHKANNEYQASLLVGAAKEQELFEQKQEALIRAQNIDNEATQAKISMMQELMTIYQEAYDAGVPGSEAYLTNLQEQIALEQQQLGIRQQATELSLQAANNQNKAADSVEKMNFGMQKQVEIGKQFGSAIADWINGTKTLSEAMKDFASKLIQQAVQLMTQWAAVFAIVSLCGHPQEAAKAANKAVFNVDGFATGGMVYGPGTSTSDSIPAMLSNGEAVLNASAVNAIGGPSTVNAINDGDLASMGAGAGNVTLNISAVDASGFGDFLARGGLDVIKQSLFEENRQFASAVGVW